MGPNLVRDKLSGTYFARVRFAGKLFRGNDEAGNAVRLVPSGILGYGTSAIKVLRGVGRFHVGENCAAQVAPGGQVGRAEHVVSAGRPGERKLKVSGRGPLC